MKAPELYSKHFISTIEKTAGKIDNPIYVLYGYMSILDLEQYQGWIVDKDTSHRQVVKRYSPKIGSHACSFLYRQALLPAFCHMRSIRTSSSR